ncbi:MAG TPA: NUDIX pyrophosphatase [Tissierellia bacterium]|jgi:dATP pyrophosphohydrolase|nr:NUDIX pyrophosphatase [Tissierellia bacterium]
MRAPFQVLAIPYKKDRELKFCVLHRADIDQYQFVSGGGEDDESPVDAIIREIREEVGIEVASVIQLKSSAYIPANIFSEKYRKFWSNDTYVIPEYTFGFECSDVITLSEEHIGFEWLNYDEAMKLLTWDSNKTALYELNCRLRINL